METDLEYKDYLVTWSINIGATSAMEAAQIARQVQLDDEPLALVFLVETYGEKKLVDLWNGDVSDENFLSSSGD